ncbi:hypothetical protein [Enterobacter kobei]
MKKPMTTRVDLPVRKTHSVLSGPTLRELRARLQRTSGIQARKNHHG